jgi:hypothetical protein
VEFQATHATFVHLLPGSTTCARRFNSEAESAFKITYGVVSVDITVRLLCATDHIDGLLY